MVALLALDQGSKIWVRHEVPSHQITELLPNLLDLTYVQNKGVSFSFLSELPDALRLPLLIGVAAIAVLGMLYYLIRSWKELDIFSKTALILILPGALGNLIDRILFGAVTDFLHFHWYQISFFVNNLADCFISIGLVFFLIGTFWTRRSSTTENHS